MRSALTLHRLTIEARASSDIRGVSLCLAPKVECRRCALCCRSLFPSCRKENKGASARRLARLAAMAALLIQLSPDRKHRSRDEKFAAAHLANSTARATSARSHCEGKVRATRFHPAVARHIRMGLAFLP